MALTPGVNPNRAEHEARLAHRDAVLRRARLVQLLLQQLKARQRVAFAELPTLRQIEAVLFADRRIDLERARNGVTDEAGASA